MVVETKMAHILLDSFQELELGEIIVKTWQEEQEDNSKGDICYLENIFAELNNPKCALSKINLTLMEVSMFNLCF